MDRIEAADVIMAAGVVLGLVVMFCGFAVLLSGSTFQARCERAFPTDPPRAELCIYNLSHEKEP